MIEVLLEEKAGIGVSLGTMRHGTWAPAGAPSARPAHLKRWACDSAALTFPEAKAGRLGWRAAS